MPALPFVGGLLKVLLQFALPGVTDVLCRLFFKGTGSTSSSALNTWASAIATNWGSNFKAQCIPDLSLVAVTADDLSSKTAPEGAWAGNIAGSNANLVSMPAAAMIIRNLVADKYRGGHSRTYLPGIPAGAQSSSGAATWSSASAATILSAWQAFLGSIDGSNGPSGYTGLAQVVPHFYSGFTSVQNPITKRWRNVPQVVTGTPVVDTIVAQTVNLNIGSQRRRNHQSV